jgi:hypothetical protein
MNKLDKQKIKNDIVSRLKGFKHLRKIIIFGSFNSAVQPNDIDIAVVDDSGKDYWTLAVAYRTKLHGLDGNLPVDLLPLVSDKFEASTELFSQEIKKGELIYEH